MKTLELGPEEVRAALDPTEYPKRQVFLVTAEGTVICSDVEEGWIAFTRPKGVRNKAWCMALKAAISSMQFHLLAAKSIHDEMWEVTEPEVHIHRFDPPKVFVNEEGSCPVCKKPSNAGRYPYCCEEHEAQDRGFL
jgi:hypothetical protein